MRIDLNERIKEFEEYFSFGGDIVSWQVFGNGHINDTFLLTLNDEKSTKIILQRMNRAIFKKPEELMENILGVTSHLRKKIIAAGGNPERETLSVITTGEGKPFYIDREHEYWRAYKFIEGASSCEQVKGPEDLYESGLAFGRFQNMLADYPAHTLHETIPGFHDTEARLRRFEEVVREDKAGRAALAEKEIKFVLDRKQVAEILGKLQRSGELPLRVTHNDTKLNNIMIDDNTGKAICVIDLDTVMPGLSANDFGDAIRFGANTGAEDEQDLSKIKLDMNLYEAYTKGFVEGCGSSLWKKELEVLPAGALVMTYECGFRFLADYLEGDIYFKIHREHHNLDRCRTQFKLIEEMEENWKELLRINQKYSNF